MVDPSSARLGKQRHCEKTDESAPTPRATQLEIPFAPDNASPSQPLGYRARRDYRMRAFRCNTTIITPTYFTPGLMLPEAEMRIASEGGKQREFEVRFEEARDDRAYLGALINTLYRERIQHRRTALAIDREAIYARIAWTSSEERSCSYRGPSLGRIATLEAKTQSLRIGPAELACTISPCTIFEAILIA
ncbi:hypothetical protein Tco_0000739 [Tanacetum coccineum]